LLTWKAREGESQEVAVGHQKKMGIACRTADADADAAGTLLLMLAGGASIHATLCAASTYMVSMIHHPQTHTCIQGTDARHSADRYTMALLLLSTACATPGT
jgi:hypothetical protein